MTDPESGRPLRLHHDEPADLEQAVERQAWTAPITHNTGDVFPASDWNTYVRDNENYLYTIGEFGSAGISGAQSIATGTQTYVALAAESIDTTGTMHDTVTNNSRITCPVAGYYLAIAATAWNSVAGGTYREAAISLNRTADQADDTRPGVGTVTNTRQMVPAINAFSANDYLELRVAHDLGSALSLVAGSLAIGRLK